jgi:CRP-like cAMP-binding protein
VDRIGSINSHAILGGLHHHYVRVWVFGTHKGQLEPIIAKVSQETLAEMIGTTRSRVSFFMNKFRKLGLIDYNGQIEILIAKCRFARGTPHQQLSKAKSA